MRAAVICCPGPSLDPADIPRLHEQCDAVVAVNRAYKAWSDHSNLQPHFIYAADGAHRYKEHEHEEIRDTGSLLVTRKEAKITFNWKKALGDVRRVRGVEVQKESGADLNPFTSGKIWRPMMTTLFAYQDLIQLGFDSLFFYGCDCHCYNRQQYWYDDPKNKDPWASRYRGNHNDSYRTVYDTLEKWVPLAGEQGVVTFNLSPKSLLGDFIETIGIGEITKWTYGTS